MVATRKTTEAKKTASKKADTKVEPDAQGVLFDEGEVGGPKTDDGGRPVTDDGGRILNVDTPPPAAVEKKAEKDADS